MARSIREKRKRFEVLYFDDEYGRQAKKEMERRGQIKMIIQIESETIIAILQEFISLARSFVMPLCAFREEHAFVASR